MRPASFSHVFSNLWIIEGEWEGMYLDKDEFVRLEYLLTLKSKSWTLSHTFFFFIFQPSRPRILNESMTCTVNLSLARYLNGTHVLRQMNIIYSHTLRFGVKKRAC